jgi:dienelactone hydrolase
LFLAIGSALILSLPGAAVSLAYKFEISLPHPNGSTLPVVCFRPERDGGGPLPVVICAGGVCSRIIPQFHEHCQALADRGFFTLLIDPSNFPYSLCPGPEDWDKFPGSWLAVADQGFVGARMAFDYEWYLDSIRATVNFASASPLADPTRIAFSGFSQPANAALTYASRDPRIKAIVWNYGGFPWTLPYDPRRIPPTLIFHGTEDRVYDVQYAFKLAGELGAAQRDYELHIYPGQPHLFNLYYDRRTETRESRPVIADSFEILVSFLYRKLFFRWLQ